MDILLQPNVAYVLLAAGLLMGVLAVLSPGTGLFEIGGLFALLLAGYAIYNLPINLWALILLVVGVFPFLLAVRRSSKPLYLVLSIAALVLGSAFLFRSEQWWVPAVHPLLALSVSVLMALYFWLVARKVLEAEFNRPRHDLEGLIGSLGEAKSIVYTEGSVQVAGELWSAQSQTPIPDGAPVRVVRRDGFILQVEPAHTNGKSPADG